MVSSLVIVPVAEPGLPTSYPVPEVSDNITVSSGSNPVSPTGVIVTITVVPAFGMVAVPVVALKVAAPD